MSISTDCVGEQPLSSIDGQGATKARTPQMRMTIVKSDPVQAPEPR